MAEYFAITERRSEKAKRIRREFREQHGKDFSPRRGKVIVPRKDGLSNCVTATQGIEQYLLEITDDFTAKGERNLTKLNEVNTEVNGKPFTYVSLFSGIGGFETALNKLGGTCVLASEIDRFANQSYEALYGHPTAGDITKIQAEDVPDHDVLVGGFPCQTFSVAGKRGGFDDARGTLFFEVARLAKTKQPRILLLENVKGLISHDGGKTLDTIVKTLNDIGYHVDFDVLNSKYFGVPQNRERIFIVAMRDDIAKPAEWIIEGTNVVAKGKRRIAAYDGVKTFNFDFPQQTEVTTRLRDVLETEVDEKYYLSDEKTAKLVAQLVDKVSSLEPTVFETRVDEGVRLFRENICGTLRTVSECGDKKIIEPQMLGHIDLKGHDVIKRIYATEGITPTLTTMGGGHREPKIAELQGLPIREATKQGYAMAAEGDSVNFQFPESKTRRGRVGKQIAINFKDNGNIRPHRMDSRKSGISELNINHEDNTSFTVTSAHAPKIYGESTRYRIRKLTPLECWRLQGFTYAQHQTVVDTGLSDSQRYKQAGNAVTVNVIHAIGERLLPYLC